MSFLATVRVAALACACHVAVAAQAPRVVTLAAPVSASDAVFTRIIAVRELSDGALLVSDRGEQRLFHLTNAGGDPSPIARTGSGPGEFRQAGWLFALPNDSSVFIDSFSGRMLVLAGARVVRTLSEHEPAALALGSSVAGVAANGGVLGATRAPIRPVGAAASNADAQIALLLSHRSNGQTDTVGSLLSPSTPVVLKPSTDGPARLFSGSPLSSQEQAALAVDGWIVVARLNPYRVDWRRPDGTWLRGAPLGVPSVAVTDREKCFAMRRWSAPGAACDVAGVQGWPTHVPPFLKPQSDGGPPVVLVDPAGLAVITRTSTADAPEARYDVVDRSGRLVRTVIVPGSRRIVGFGRSTVLVAATDADDLQAVERYNWRD